jgi:hypothetical protein
VISIKDYIVEKRLHHIQKSRETSTHTTNKYVETYNITSSEKRRKQTDQDLRKREQKGGDHGRG